MRRHVEVRMAPDTFIVEWKETVWVWDNKKSPHEVKPLYAVELLSSEMKIAFRADTWKCYRTLPA